MFLCLLRELLIVPLSCCAAAANILSLDLVPVAQGHSGLEKSWSFTPFMIPSLFVPLFLHLLGLPMKVECFVMVRDQLDSRLNSCVELGFNRGTGIIGRGKQAAKRGR